MQKDLYLFNHHPEQVGIWFKYNGFRYKLRYDIETYDGVVYENAYPNGNAWLHPEGRTTDQEVCRLKLTTNLGVPTVTRMTQSQLVSWVLESYDPSVIPEVRIAPDGSKSYHPKLLSVDDVR